MKKTFTILIAALMLLAMFASPMRMLGEETTVDITMNDYVSSNNCTVSSGNSVTLYTSLSLSTDITMSTSGNPNCGSFWGTSTNDWRLYQNQNGDVTISTSNGTLNKVQIYYNISNGGVLKNGGATVGTGAAVNVSGNSITLTVGNSGTATNGQVKITRVIVKYTPAGGPTPTTYTVTYDANGGTGTMTDSNSPYTAGATVTVLGNEFTRTNYDFDHWNTAADDSGTSYDEDDTFTINANTTLYAQWTPQGGGSTTTETLTVGTNGNCTWSNGVKTSQATVGSVTFDALGSGSNDGKYYNSDQTWRFYTASTSGLKVSVPQGNKITSVKITWKTGQPITPDGFTASGTTSPTTYTADNTTSVNEVRFMRNNTANVLFQVLEVTYESLSSVAAPTISPAGCSFTGTKQITITPASGTTLYYTTNGNDPDNSGTGYTTAQTISISTTTTVKAIAYSGNEFSSIVSETYTYLTPLTTMQQIFNAATSTATTVAITFGNWVVSGANTSSHAFVTDGTSGFMIYASGHGFTEGDILSGTVVCDVQLYNGAVEITGLKSDTSGLTVTPNGTVTVANITMANLAAINTGALVHYENLICEARTEGDYTNYYLSDGTNEIQVYKTLFNNYADYLEDGNTYNITGVFILNNSTKRVNPRSAADIEVISPVINADDVDIAYNTTSGSITYSIDNEPTPAGTLTVSKNGNWLTLGNVTSTTVPFTCSANNSTTARTATVTLTYTYGSNQTVTKSVTVTQAAYVPAPTSDPFVRISNLTDLTDGSIVVIAARYNGEQTDGYKAMPSTMSEGKPIGVNFTSTTSGDDEILPTTITNDINDYYWIVNISEDNYKFTNANGDFISYGSSGTDFTKNGTKYAWSIARETSESTAMIAEYTGFVITNVTTNNRGFAFNGSVFGAYATSNLTSDSYNFFLDFFVQKETPTTATYYYSVNGTLSEEHTCAVGSTKTLETGTDLYSNFTFAGWTTAAHDVSSPISSYTFADQGPVTFYAVYAHNSNNYTRVFNETATADIDIIGPSIIPSFGLLDMDTYEIDLVGVTTCLIIEEGGQLIYSGEEVRVDYQKNITAPSGTWGQNDNTGWYAISSPTGRYSKTSEINDFEYFVADARRFDFFAYGEKCGWYNKTDAEHYVREVKAGYGYLYAREVGTMVVFHDDACHDDYNLTNLSYTSSRGTLAGLHCIGNPYTHNIYKGVGITGDMTTGYYALNEATGAWISTTDATAIVPTQAILVFVNKTDGTAAIHMTSDNSAPSSKANNDYIKFNVANSKYEDVAYAWFDKGEGLKKINHRNSEVPMLYIPQYNTNYSIAYMSDNTDMFNLNFKAMTTGKYTLSVSEKGDFSYLHIYDRLTGEDVDMLNDDYSFIGAPSDNEARFIVRLSYSAGNGSDINTFAFQNGSDIIVNGEGELQIFDVMGRMVKNTVINGVETIAMPQGVYIFRLNENIQKIVVR